MDDVQLEMPEGLSLTNALARFRHRAHQMGIIVDGSGMWTGIVTIEDLIEQMIGEIDDESAFSRDEAPVSLADALSPARIVLELQASSMIEVIEKIVHSIPREELPTDAQTILRALTEREEQMTNYSGGGVAVPHAHLDGIDKPTLALGRRRRARRR
jgi:CBS domain containing-hemolysin-like protein